MFADALECSLVSRHFDNTLQKKTKEHEYNERERQRILILFLRNKIEWQQRYL
jgi:hypothetical protein